MNSTTSANNLDTIREFVAQHFLPDVDPAEIAGDFDLIESGTVDSLGLLRLISWLADHYELSLDEIVITPDQFRTIQAIDNFVIVARDKAVSTSAN
jgi:acyl carrier protein